MTPVALFELVLVLLGATLLLSIVAGKLHLPPAIALVVGGMALALVPKLPVVELDPDLILVLFLPPLLMSSAYFTVWRDFVQYLRPILFLSVGAVIFTTALVGAVAHLVVPSLPWAACFALGAIVSPPDAVAAKAVLERLKLPRRMMTVLEGESLVNDASGLVLYKFAVAAALTGSFGAASAGATFVWVAIGGIAVGIVCSLAFTTFAARVRDGQLLIVSSLLCCYASYILADRLGVSSVLSTVACGLFAGYRSHQMLGAQDRVASQAVWGFIVYVLEALVFVLIGLALRGVLHRHGDDAGIWSGLPMALAVTATVVVARLAWVFPAANLPRMLWPWRVRREARPPAASLLIVGWAGMRGVVTLAAALALPLDFPGRDKILFAAFVVILFTVVVQGLTLGPLIRTLKLAPPQETSDLLDAVAARLAINEAALVMLEALKIADSSDLMHPKLTEEYRRRLRALTRLRDERELMEHERQDHFATALAAAATARTELIRLHRTRKIHDSVLRTLEAELDLEEIRLKRLSGIGAD